MIPTIIPPQYFPQSQGKKLLNKNIKKIFFYYLFVKVMLYHQNKTFQLIYPICMIKIMKKNNLIF